MQALLQMYRRLDLLQQTLWFRLAASIVALAISGGFFGSLLATSYSIDSQRQALKVALSNQNYHRGDEHAVSLRQRGEVTVNGRTYGGPAYLTPRVDIFDNEGNIIRVGDLAESFLMNQRPQWAPGWLLDDPNTTWLLTILVTAWLLGIVWMSITVPFLLTLMGTAIPVGVAYLLDRPQLMLAFAGMGLLTFTFVLLTRVALLALNQPYQVPAVAHTVIKEASRRGISVVFIVLLLFILPLLPLMLNPASPLRFQIQTYISWSLSLTFAIAALMTLFFACASVAFEIRDRQIWQLMTKPVARINYLLGKWLGVLILNFIILAVSGVSTFTFIQYLRAQPVENTEAGMLDYIAVREEVLTARRSTRPQYEQLTPEQIRLRVDQIIENDPQLAGQESVPLRHRQMLAQQLQRDYAAMQRSVPPGFQHDYVFTGLKEARRLGATVTLKYKFFILRDDEHQTFNAIFYFNDDVNTRRLSTFVPTMTHTLLIPSSYIRDDGTLKVSMVNVNVEGEKRGAINFDEKNFELLYRADSFEMNFLRAILTMWVKLAFLGALGIGCATFLSFPVACLLSFTVFIAGMLGPFLTQALEWYGAIEFHEVEWTNIGMVLQWAFEASTSSIASAVVFLLGSFGEYKPTQSLVEGRLIEWSQVFYGFLKLVAFWSGLAMLLGYVVLRKRQLAIYSGQG